jgi:CubicO group peptidase (beta-lactamase class C family)
VRHLVLVAALLLAGCRATPRADGDGDVARRLDALFAELEQKHAFTGAVLVGRGERVLWRRGIGYANVEQRVPFTPDTPGDAASIAKTFTAALVVTLADERILELDAPVQRYLPELPYPAVTLRHLLSHASGIPVLDYDYFDHYIPRGEIRTTERLLAVIAAQAPPLWFEPGTRFMYSSFGYDLAALAAARATNRPFAELLAERFFRPLGLTSAFVRPGRLAEFPGVRALGYDRGRLRDVFDFEAFHGGSNIYISAADLQRWNAYWLAHDRPALLEPARIGGAPSGITLGSWYRARDGSATWYPGHLEGFHSVVFRDADHHSIVYIANNTLDPWLHHGIVRAIRSVLAGREPASPAPAAVARFGKDDRRLVVGRWTTRDGESLQIADAPAFTLERAGVAYRIVPMSETALYVPGLDYVIGFGRDPRGEITKMYLSTNVDERWATRAR